MPFRQLRPERLEYVAGADGGVEFLLVVQDDVGNDDAREPRRLFLFGRLRSGAGAAGGASAIS